MSDLILPGQTQAEPDEHLPDRGGSMILLLAMVCPKCQQQAGIEVKPMPIFALKDGTLVADPQGHEDDIMGQAMVVALPHASLKCPQCSGSGLVRASGLVTP